jgi:hypothetical protein
MMTEPEICFICGVRISRGNRSEIGPQEKMDKLVSVSNTVEHSSTIISDILSRILNETVLREEIVCRICFNLLNDIDYHLKVRTAYPTAPLSTRSGREAP